jgi:hypothetical protein
MRAACKMTDAGRAGSLAAAPRGEDDDRVDEALGQQVVKVRWDSRT